MVRRLPGGRKYEHHNFEAPTNRLICSGVDEHVNSESYAVLTKVYRERSELLAESASPSKDDF